MEEVMGKRGKKVGQVKGEETHHFSAYLPL